jgi:hypothetical protein
MMMIRRRRIGFKQTHVGLIRRETQGRRDRDVLFAVLFQIFLASHLSHLRFFDLPLSENRKSSEIEESKSFNSLKHPSTGELIIMSTQ